MSDASLTSPSWLRRLFGSPQERPDSRAERATEEARRWLEWRRSQNERELAGEPGETDPDDPPA